MCTLLNNYDISVQINFKIGLSKNHREGYGDVAKRIDLSLSNLIMMDKHCSIKGYRTIYTHSKSDEKQILSTYIMLL